MLQTQLILTNTSNGTLKTDCYKHKASEMKIDLKMNSNLSKKRSPTE